MQQQQKPFGLGVIKLKLASLNGLDGLDRRTAAGKRALALREALAADAGGWENLTAGRRELIDAAALTSAIIDDNASRYFSGNLVDIPMLMGVIGVQRRLLVTIGVDRRDPLNVTPAVDAYLAASREADA